MSATDAEIRAVAAVTAGLLGQGRHLHAVSRLLTFAAVLGLVTGTIFASAAAAIVATGLATLLGLMETYLALRVGFDASLFERLSDRAGSLPGLDALDGAMTALGLIDAGEAGRPIEARTAGALRLLVWQGCALAGQASILIVGAFAAWRLA